GSSPWIPEYFNCHDWRFRNGESETELPESELCSQLVDCETQTSCDVCALSYWSLGESCVWCGPPGSEYDSAGSCDKAKVTTGADEITGFVSITFGMCPAEL